MNPMRTIIAGSRTCPSSGIVYEAVRCAGINICEVISGCAQGVDRFGEEYAHSAGLPVKQFPADWATHGRAAGHIRNHQMLHVADALIAVWDGKSSGTRHMIKIAQAKGITTYVHRF
jgi:YspA, cpYpsA-related SLOG family